jgi:hypothetical protein
MKSEVFLDPIDFLREIYSRDIPYLLVGRQALVLLGAPLMTANYEFYLSPEPEHLEELLSLARERGLEVTTKNPERLPFFSLLSDTLKLDFFRARAYSLKKGGAFTFEELFARKRIVPVEDFAVYIPTISDLIKLKQVRDSPKDREDIKYLQVLLERENA